MFSLTPWNKKENNERRPLMRRLEHPASRLRDEFDALFDRFFGRLPALFETDWGLDRWGWGLDLDDTGKEIVVRAEAPGFEADDFDVQVSGNLLTIRAERKHESKKDKGDYHVEERKFQRSVTLPAGLDVDRVQARYHNGVLDLRFAKSPEAQGRRIEVKT